MNEGFMTGPPLAQNGRFEPGGGADVTRGRSETLAGATRRHSIRAGEEAVGHNIADDSSRGPGMNLLASPPANDPVRGLVGSLLTGSRLPGRQRCLLTGLPRIWC